MRTEKRRWKLFFQKITNSRLFTPVIMTLILINAVIVGIETYEHIYQGNQMLFFTLDRVLLWIFTVEIVIRLLATPSLRYFFKSGWNWFDFLIVAAGHLFAGAHFVTVLRVLRVLRVFRAVSIIPSLRRLVDALMRTIPSLGNILLLMGIIFYIFAVIGTMLFQSTAPEYFGNLQLSLLTLFQVVTLESWASQVMRPIFEELWWSWIYFIGFILVGTFVIFNLFIGVIVSNVEKSEKEEDTSEDDTKEELKQLRTEIKELKDLLNEQYNR